MQTIYMCSDVIALHTSNGCTIQTRHFLTWVLMFCKSAKHFSVAEMQI